MPRYWEPSGRFTATGLLRGLLWGSLWGALAGFIYSYSILYLPLIELNIAALVVFALVVGAATALALRGGRVQHRPAVMAVAAVTALLSLYFAWAVWLKALFHRNDFPLPLTGLLAHPSIMWQVIVAVNGKGAWSFHGWSPTGIPLWIVWALEAAAILAIAMALGGMLPFDMLCDSCGSYADLKTKAKLAAGDADTIKRQLESNDLRAVLDRGPAPPDAKEWLELSLETCKKCGKTNALSAAIVSPMVTKEGQKLEGRTKIITRLMLAEGDAAMVKQSLATLSAPTPAEVLAGKAKAEDDPVQTAWLDGVMARMMPDKLPAQFQPGETVGQLIQRILTEEEQKAREQEPDNARLALKLQALEALKRKFA